MNSSSVAETAVQPQALDPASAATSTAFTPGPWSHHVGVGCNCNMVCSKTHPVAKVTAGDWGDDYPSIRRLGGSLEPQFEAFIDQITYGNIPQETANANARLIAMAPDLLWFAQQILNANDTGLLDSPADATLARVISQGRAFVFKAVTQ